jgi:hypothetical protein
MASASAQAACTFGDATYERVEERPGDEPAVLEPFNQANGIFVKTGNKRRQFYVDLPNNPPPGYQMGIAHGETWKSYPTFVPGPGGEGQVNAWPGETETAPDWILIQGLGKFELRCPG